MSNNSVWCIVSSIFFPFLSLTIFSYFFSSLLSSSQATISVCNSSLSEAAILGFEYGYRCTYNYFFIPMSLFLSNLQSLKSLFCWVMSLTFSESFSVWFALSLPLRLFDYHPLSFSHPLTLFLSLSLSLSIYLSISFLYLILVWATRWLLLSGKLNSEISPMSPRR